MLSEELFVRALTVHGHVAAAERHLRGALALARADLGLADGEQVLAAASRALDENRVWWLASEPPHRRHAADPRLAVRYLVRSARELGDGPIAERLAAVLVGVVRAANEPEPPSIGGGPRLA